MSSEIVTAISGAISSFLSGLLGIGGGIVMTPLLLYLPPLVGTAALPVKIVTGLTVVQALSGSILGTLRHRRYGNVAMPLVWTMGIPGGAASLFGALLSRDAPDRLLLFVFASFATLAAVALMLPSRPQQGPADELRVNVPVAMAIALVIGFFGGMVGIGAIAFIVAALVYVLRIPVHVAIGSSLAIGFFSAVPAFIGKAVTGQIDPSLGAIVAVSALVASPLGAAVSRRSAPRLLMSLLTAIVALSAVRIFYQAFTGA